MALIIKELKTIAIESITQIDKKTTLLGSSILLSSKDFGFIEGSNFTKNDNIRIKKLIEIAFKKKYK